jgi:hypothetical protein
MALKARDNNINNYAGHLEELAAEVSAHADRLSGKVQQPSGRQQRPPQCARED